MVLGNHCTYTHSLALLSAGAGVGEKAIKNEMQMIDPSSIPILGLLKVDNK